MPSGGFNTSIQTAAALWKRCVDFFYRLMKAVLAVGFFFLLKSFLALPSHSILLEQISLHAPSSRGSTSPRLSQGEIVRALIKTLGLSEDLRRLEEMRETVDQVWGARRYFASPCALRYCFRKGKGGGWGYIPLQLWARLERHAEADPARMSFAFYTM